MHMRIYIERERDALARTHAFIFLNKCLPETGGEPTQVRHEIYTPLHETMVIKDSARDPYKYHHAASLRNQKVKAIRLTNSFIAQGSPSCPEDYIAPRFICWQ